MDKNISSTVIPIIPPEKLSNISLDNKSLLDTDSIEFPPLGFAEILKVLHLIPKMVKISF